jgi:hypothetical protein
MQRAVRSVEPGRSERIQKWLGAELCAASTLAFELTRLPTRFHDGELVFQPLVDVRARQPVECELAGRELRRISALIEGISSRLVTYTQNWSLLSTRSAPARRSRASS